jgi:hypothetical protein
MLNRINELIHTMSKSTFDCDLDAALRGSNKRTDAFWGMNRQFVRTLILLKLLSGLETDAFFETGTNLGRTCFLIASQTKLPIYSSEVNRDCLRSARRLLFPFGRRVHLFNEDSVGFLKRVLGAKRFRSPFFYLDAHWSANLPLREEISAILCDCPNFVIMVDDFVVPNDPGFGYDVYNGVPLDLTLVQDTLVNSMVKVSVWFPSYYSELETGSRRGWTLITTADIQGRIKKLIPNDLLSVYMEV